MVSRYSDGTFSIRIFKKKSFAYAQDVKKGVVLLDYLRFFFH
jgi:hypothetical protein